MNRKMRWIECAVFASTLAAALASGCGGRSGSGSYAPSSASAKKALEASLDEWKKGAKPEELALDSVPVHPVDYQWLSGVALESYAVLNEEDQTGAENTKLFTVDLKLKPPAKPVKAKYLVVGKSPIWVYRNEDFARLLNMDNNPTPAKGAGTKKR